MIKSCFLKTLGKFIMNFSPITMPIRYLIYTLFYFCTFQSFLNAQTHYPKREMRGVWIATVLNIDWPTSKDQSPERQRKYFRWILDNHQKNGINAIFVQVRTASDALYSSKLAPWSEWLTGEQGKSPEPYYDPLKFMIEEAHQRGMEFHAWLNPYRVSISSSNNCDYHISKKYPQWCVQYGKNKYLNPGIPEVRQHIKAIVSELVEKYDIDGIHFDDYFYPYPIKGWDFNDQATFGKYNYGIQDKAKWRRRNISLMIEIVAKEIKKMKPYLKFGISPPGVWRNKKNDPSGSPTNGVYTAYDNLYADIRLWLSRGWIDYVVPQIYFSFDHKLVPYKPLAKWWFKNSFDKHLYIGQAAYKINHNTDKSWHNTSQLPQQIQFNRQFRNIKGSVFFSSKSITRNYGHFQDSLRLKLYKYPALVPSMPWKDKIPPNPPQNLEVFNTKSGVLLVWEKPKIASDHETASYYVIYRIPKGEKIDLSNPQNILRIHRQKNNIFLDKSAKNEAEYAYFITAIDRLHNESLPSYSVKIQTQISAPTASYQPMSSMGSLTDFLKIFFKIYLKYNKI